MVEDREGLGTLIMRMMSGGCEVDTVGGAVTRFNCWELHQHTC